MGRVKKESVNEIVDNLDLEEDSTDTPVINEDINNKKEAVKKGKKEDMSEEKELINCLRNERIIVRYLPKQSGIVTNPKHVLYGGMAEEATKTYVVPRLSSGMFVNVLTDSEKDYLENIMGFEDNALSIYKKKDNFWDDSNPDGINKVSLKKHDNYFNLADPEDYIRYKILLANKNDICPSIQAYEDMPKATYKFVVIREGDETDMARQNMSITMLCYKEFGKVENDFDTLKTIIETFSGKPLSMNTKLEFLQAKINEYIQTDSKLLYKIMTDELLPTKVLIKNAINAGIISNRGNYLYLKEGNLPLCNNGEEPTMTFAARYLNLPKNQELKFNIEAKLKK